MTYFKFNYNYEVLLLLLKKEMHQREIAKELHTSLTRIQAILKELREISVLDYRESGKNHIYFIKKNLIAKSFILNAENYKLAKVLQKTPEFGPLFQDIIRKSNVRLIILFGSYAKGVAKSESDIDVYIETTNQVIKQDIQGIYSFLSIKIGKFNSDDLLIKEIIKNHVLIKGGEYYYEKIHFFE